jgi:hypothetical protein
MVGSRLDAGRAQPSWSAILQLQRSAGNRAVTGLLRPPGGGHGLSDAVTIQRLGLIPHYRLKGSGAEVTNPGCAITWTGKNITLSGLIQTFGPKSSPTVASEIKKTIETYWNGSFDDGSSISATTTVTHRDDKTSPDTDRTQIRVTDSDTPSHVHPQYVVAGANTMDLNLGGGAGDTDWTPAHEFGHLLGLPDHYSESLSSKVKGIIWGESARSPTPEEKGWEGNIMAVDHGVADKRNVAEFLRKYATELTNEDVPSA